MKHLPPDASLQRLAKIVNVRLASLDAGVSFYRIEHGDHSTETGIVFQCGVRRAVVRTQAMLGDADADELVRSVKDWITEIRPSAKWTTDPAEAA